MRDTVSSLPDPAHDTAEPGWRLIGGGVALLLVSMAVRALWRAEPAPIVPKRGPASRIQRCTHMAPPPPKPIVVAAPEGELILPPAQHEPKDVTPRFIAGAFALLFG